jgi:hypothetical protein
VEGTGDVLLSEVKGVEIVHYFRKIIAVVNGDHRVGVIVLWYQLHVGQVRPAQGRTQRDPWLLRTKKFLSRLISDGSELTCWRSRSVEDTYPGYMTEMTR